MRHEDNVTNVMIEATEKSLADLRVNIALATAAVALGESPEWAIFLQSLRDYAEESARLLIKTDAGEREIGRLQGKVNLAQRLIATSDKAAKNLEQFVAQEDGLQKQLRTLRTGER